MKLVIASHGNFANELLKSAEMIYGDMSDVPAVSLMPGMSFEEFTKKASRFWRSLARILWFSLTSSEVPLQRVFSAHQDFGHQVVTGLNLPMLIEVYSTMKGILHLLRSRG